MYRATLRDPRYGAQNGPYFYRKDLHCDPDVFRARKNCEFLFAKCGIKKKRSEYVFLENDTEGQKNAILKKRQIKVNIKKLM